MQLIDLHGTWTLEYFILVRANGANDPWGQDMVGILIYAPSGHVSVAINRAPDTTKLSDAERNFDASLFYAGTYFLDGDTVHHKVTVASNLSRVGKDMFRHAHLEDGLLTLTCPREAFGTAKLLWRKLT